MFKSKPEFKRPPMANRYYDIDDIIGTASRRKYLEDLKILVEGQQNKAANVKFKDDLIKHKNKMNYVTELERIRGELLSKPRLPEYTKTRKQLEAREEHLRKLIEAELMVLNNI